jgi:hypothetical protein
MFNVNFNNISVILWWSVLLVEYPEKTTDLSHLDPMAPTCQRLLTKPFLIYALKLDKLILCDTML